VQLAFHSARQVLYSPFDRACIEKSCVDLSSQAIENTSGRISDRASPLTRYQVGDFGPANQLINRRQFAV
jgi:hypothetical protein